MAMILDRRWQRALTPYFARRCTVVRPTVEPQTAIGSFQPDVGMPRVETILHDDLPISMEPMTQRLGEMTVRPATVTVMHWQATILGSYPDIRTSDVIIVSGRRHNIVSVGIRPEVDLTDLMLEELP